MTAYALRRLFYALPILVGVNLFTFVLFFVVNPPDAVARVMNGEKASPQVLEDWKRERGYHLPPLWNGAEAGLGRITQTIFFQKSASLFLLDFGHSDRDRDHIGTEMRRRIPASLSFTVPIFLLSLAANVSMGLLVAFYRATPFDRTTLFLCVLFMSISGLFYIIGGQYLLAIHLKLVPISGYASGLSAGKFLVLPILVGVVGSFGGGVRFNRTLFLEEIGKDYVRTARAKGLSEAAVLFVHVLKNAMIPILTSAIVAIPFLIMGSLLTEAFFGIPGLGGFTIDAINGQDYAIVRATVFLGSLLFIVSQILTDLAYTLVDPRVRLGGGVSLRDLGYALLCPAAFGAAALGIAAGAGGLRGAWEAWLKGHPDVDETFLQACFEHAVVAALLAGAALFLLRSLRREPWSTAWRQLGTNRLAKASLAVLLAYVSVGVLDSVAWRDPVRDEAGAERRDASGRPVLEASRRSLLDRLWTRSMGDLKEATYSSPLAQEQLSRKMRLDEQGRARWENPPLRHPGRHLLGTDKVGQDVFFRALKGVRTALVIGGMTLLISIPFAIAFGVLAGYFGGWVDDFIQYGYTTLASVPSILLMVAFLMIFKERSLWQICLVLGITSWTGLCRLVRAETLKLRELEYVQAAKALGVSRLVLLARHVVPNLLHLVTISAVLQFSGLVLSEAVLSYVGLSVGTDTGSWGNMINTARLELTRDPVVWWNLAGAFVLMFGLVLPANLFGDALRDALDPRLRIR